MKKQFQQLMFALFILLCSTTIKAQFTLSDAQYWTGRGTDSSILVVDFQAATWENSLIISRVSNINHSRFLKK